jgi:hypothetical protein
VGVYVAARSIVTGSIGKKKDSDEEAKRATLQTAVMNLIHHRERKMTKGLISIRASFLNIQMTIIMTGLSIFMTRLAIFMAGLTILISIARVFLRASSIL